MDKKLVAFALVLVLCSVGFYLLLFPVGTSFRFAKNSPADNEAYLIGVKNIQDCVITVSFVNDSNLLYDIDIEMYGFSSITVFYLYEDEYSTLLNYYTGPNRAEWTADEVRVKSLAIVLGTGKAYNIAIAGINLTTSFTYENGALIGQDSYVSYYPDGGSADITYNGSDVDSSTLAEYLAPTRIEFNFGTGGAGGLALDSTLVDVDLPYFSYGDVDINADTIEIVTEGWEKATQVDSYYTLPVDGFPPRFFLDIFSSSVDANLFKPINP